MEKKSRKLLWWKNLEKVCVIETQQLFFWKKSENRGLETIIISVFSSYMEMWYNLSQSIFKCLSELGTKTVKKVSHADIWLNDKW